MQLIKNIFLGWCLMLFISHVNAQLITFPGQTPQSLVQNVLLGSGVSVSNIVFTGQTEAISKFIATGTNLGINEGIVLTTGTTKNNSFGPQGPNNQANAGIDNGALGNPLLTNIIGSSTYNAALLEFDFIPYSDTVRFKYVFGSEEYPEFAPPNNSAYNDVFGFFISGPGFVGEQNIARLQNGAIVSINNVNAVTNIPFYVANGDGSSSPQNSSAAFIQYDGFTQVLQAVAKVQCGQKYHLKIAVADAGDAVFDSGIFLEANSLSSKTPVEITYALSSIAFGANNIMAEGCVSATITLKRSNNLNTALTIPITVNGTATELVDYSDVPNSVTFNPGQEEITLTINALADATTEGLETLGLNFLLTDPCGNVNPVPINLKLDDVFPVQINMPDVTMTCPGTALNLAANPTGGGGQYVYNWSTGANTPSILVNPPATTTYSVSVTDNCLNQTVTEDVVVTIPVYGPIIINESADISEPCPYKKETLSCAPTGGAGGYDIRWKLPNGTFSSGSTLIIQPATTSIYWVYVTDQCGQIDSSSILYTITSPPLTASISPDQEICPGDSAFISVTAQGGFGTIYYSWNNLQSSNPSLWVKPTSNQSYTATIHDDCNTFTISKTTQVNVIVPHADFIVTSSTLFDNFPITFMNQSSNGLSAQWTFGDGNSSWLKNPTNTYLAPGDYVVTLISEDTFGCLDTIAKPIHIEQQYFIYLPNSFTPDGSRLNETFSGYFTGLEQLEITIFNRWGELVFHSNDINFNWDGKSNNIPVQPGAYTWRIKCKTNSGKELSYLGHVNVLR
jgi:gliding motility-associated-like protein